MWNSSWQGPRTDQGGLSRPQAAETWHRTVVRCRTCSQRDGSSAIHLQLSSHHPQKLYRHLSVCHSHPHSQHKLLWDVNQCCRLSVSSLGVLCVRCFVTLIDSFAERLLYTWKGLRVRTTRGFSASQAFLRQSIRNLPVTEELAPEKIKASLCFCVDPDASR